MHHHHPFSFIFLVLVGFLFLLVGLCSSQECSKWRDGPCGFTSVLNFDDEFDVNIFVLTDGEGNLEATGSAFICAYSGSTTYEIDDDCNLLMDWELDDCVLEAGILDPCVTPEEVCTNLPTSIAVTDDDCIEQDDGGGGGGGGGGGDDDDEGDASSSDDDDTSDDDDGTSSSSNLQDFFPGVPAAFFVLFFFGFNLFKRRK